jgi:hypothetical protein
MRAAAHADLVVQVGALALQALARSAVRIDSKVVKLSPSRYTQRLKWTAPEVGALVDGFNKVRALAAAIQDRSTPQVSQARAADG